MGHVRWEELTADGSGAVLTWDLGLTTQRKAKGLSDPVKVTHDHQMELQVRIVQIKDLEDGQEAAKVVGEISRALSPLKEG